MVTSIQISEETKKELLEYASLLQAKLGKKVSFDEAIKASLHDRKAVDEARQKFDSFFGCLAGEKGVLEDLERSRRADRIALERKASRS